jgi:hypothetical protein
VPKPAFTEKYAILSVYGFSVLKNSKLLFGIVTKPECYHPDLLIFIRLKQEKAENIQSKKNVSLKMTD